MYPHQNYGTNLFYKPLPPSFSSLRYLIMNENFITIYEFVNKLQLDKKYNKCSMLMKNE